MILKHIIYLVSLVIALGTIMTTLLALLGFFLDPNYFMVVWEPNRLVSGFEILMLSFSGAVIASCIVRRIWRLIVKRDL